MLSTTIGQDPTIQTLFSDDRVYRYVWVKQVIENNFRICLFIMLNPSTADEYGPDPTIRRCIKFAQKWNRGILIVLNLFALRSTDPLNLKRVTNPVGPTNDVLINTFTHRAQHAICAWGNHGSLKDRSAQVLTRLRGNGVLLCHLGLNQSGEPKHPLYLPNSQELSPFELPQEGVRVEPGLAEPGFYHLPGILGHPDPC